MDKLLIIGLAAAVCLGCLWLASGVTVDVDNGRIYSPQAEARATAIAQAAEDAAARAAAERTAAEQVRPAQTAALGLIWLAVGLGVLVLMLGGAFAAVAWLGKRASSVYPDAKGQYPVITRRGWGWLVVHDPNRGMGPTACYETPTLLDQVIRVVLALRSGERLRLARPMAAFPATGSEEAMTQIAGQAQAVGLMAAATRPVGLLGGQAMEAREAAHRVADAGGLAAGNGPAGRRMPSVRVIDDDVQAADQAARLLPLFEDERDGE